MLCVPTALNSAAPKTAQSAKKSVVVEEGCVWGKDGCVWEEEGCGEKNSV